MEKQQIIYKGIPIRVTCDHLTEPLQASRKQHDTLKVTKGKNLQPRLLYQQGFHSFKGEIKSYTNKQKLREFSTATTTVKL